PTQHERLRQGKLKWHDGALDLTGIISDLARKPVYSTHLGALFAVDCIEILPAIKDRTVDTVFADPPFNLAKQYGRNTNDDRPENDYLEWCYRWLGECVRVLKPGGALFVYNLPKWNILLGAFLMQKGMEFRHWIAIEISACLPIPKRLHPSHY